MTAALVIGGTGFVGRHTVAALLDHDYAVATFSRDTHGFRFPASAGVDQFTGDRSDDDALADAAYHVDPDVVVDCTAYQPADVRTATELFADVDAYVYVSSGAVYGEQEIPKREDETPLHAFTDEHAGDESMATYGPRKAECDRIVRAAAERGVAATSVRPTVVYGPQTIPAADDAFAADDGFAADDALATDDDAWTSTITTVMLNASRFATGQRRRRHSRTGRKASYCRSERRGLPLNRRLTRPQPTLTWRTIMDMIRFSRLVTAA